MRPHLLAGTCAGLLLLTTTAAAQAQAPVAGTLAYAQTGMGAAENGIYTVPAAGGTPTRRAGQGAAAAWSPDGSRLAFGVLRRDHPFPQLFVAPAAGGPSRAVAAQAADPAWSPDGKRIAVNTLGLSVVPATGGPSRTLIPGSPTSRASVSNPVWAGDARIVYQSSTVPRTATGRSIQSLRSIPATGGRSTPIPVRLPAPWLLNTESLAISPDRTLLAISVYHDDPVGAAPTAATGVATGIAIVPVGGGTATTVIPGPFGASFSPDGSMLCAWAQQVMLGSGPLTILDATTGAVVASPGVSGSSCSWTAK